MRILRAFLLLLLSIAAGCSDSSDLSQAAEPAVQAELVPFDSIGIENGDSNYVFGIPRALEFTSTGNIVIGDISKMKLMMYSPAGEFLRSGGSEGEGPGEYIAPTGISPTHSGGILVADAMGGKLIFYDSLFICSNELTGFVPYPPENPEMLNDGSIVGTRIIFDEETGRLCNTLGKWVEGDIEMSFGYLERSADFDPSDPRGAYRDTGIDYCVLQDGRVVASPLSTEEYTITCYGESGEIEWEVQPDFEKQKRSEEDIEIEREMMRAAMRRNGRDPSFVDQMEISEWALAVTGIYEHEGSIWVRRGGGIEPFFDIFSVDGAYLYSCSVPSLPYGSSVGFAISPYSSSILAYLANPEDYPRIWLLREIHTESGESVPEPEQSDPQLSSPGLTQCTLQVHTDLDPFEISIYWIGSPDVPEGFRMAHTLTVSASEAGSESLFEGLEAYYHDSSDLGGYLITEDMNFDGYIDFRLMESPSAGPNTSWYFWLFDPDQGEFYRSRSFEEFDLISPEFLQEDKMIRCFHRDGMGEYGTEYYIVEGDLPVLIRSERTVYTEADSSVTTVTELINGEMIVTEQNTEAVF